MRIARSCDPRVQKRAPSSIGDDGKLTSFTYETYLADDALLAPSALFHPVLFKLTEGSKRLRVMGIDRGDPEDPHDHIYLSETSRKYTKVKQKLFLFAQRSYGPLVLHTRYHL